jgi:hypothetical protein
MLHTADSIWKKTLMVTGLLLVLIPVANSDTLVVDQQLTCENIDTVYWENNQLSIGCAKPVNPPPATPQPSPPVSIPPSFDPPVVIPPLPPITLPPISVGCPDPEPNVRVATFSGKGIDQEFTLSNGQVLVVPFNSGPSGTVKKIALGDPGRGEHFKKTVIISQCPGTFNPGSYDFNSSLDICVVTGLELSFSVIAGNSRADYPISSYRCVLVPNQKYHLTIFQLDAGSRPPFTANTQNTCRSNECGVRVSIR